MERYAFDDTTPDVRAVVEEYLAAVERAVGHADAELARETLEGLREHFAETLGPGSSFADAEAAVESLGAPETVAESLIGGTRATADGPEAVAPGADAGGATGTLLGVPYDVRVPTAERIASRWWNPGDSRIFMPRVFGLGWDINFGAVAVRVGLVRPDDEDEPFGQVPSAWFAGLLFVPVAATLWMGFSYVTSRASLPAQLPSHWGLSGAPDSWSPAPVAFGILFALAIVPTVWAASAIGGHRGPLAKGASLAFATLMCAMAAGLWGLTLATADGAGVGWWAPALIVFGAFALPFVQLVTLALVGRHAEMERDLGRARKG